MSKRDEKKQEFMSGEARYKGPNRIIVISFVLVALVVVGIVMQLTKDDTVVPRRWEGGTYNIGETVDYKGKTVSMTNIKLEIADGKYSIPLDVIKEAKFVYAPTEYQYRNGNKAVAALITPAGRLVVAIAMCEPCRSERFHIEGNILVCDTCGTRWQLNDLQGLSGGCVPYPPEEMPYEVKNGMVVFDPALVDEWEPRI